MTVRIYAPGMRTMGEIMPIVPFYYPSESVVISPMFNSVKNDYRRKTRAYRANWISGNKKKLKNFN